MHNANSVDTTSHLDDDSQSLLDAMNQCVRQALRRHKLLGQSVAVWRDGKAIVIPPEEIRIDDDPPASSAL